MSRFRDSSCLSVPPLLALLLVSSLLSLSSEASVHDYRGDMFVPKGNAFFIHGGSEGLYSSLPDHNESSAAANGDSYIRIGFCWAMRNTARGLVKLKQLRSLGVLTFLFSGSFCCKLFGGFYKQLVAKGFLVFWFEKITSRRNKEFTNFSSWPIQAVVFEVEDREAIGRSAYGGQRAVCCTSDLEKLGVCTEGHIIHRPSAQFSDWP